MCNPLTGVGQAPISTTGSGNVVPNPQPAQPGQVAGAGLGTGVVNATTQHQAAAAAAQTMALNTGLQGAAGPMPALLPAARSQYLPQTITVNLPNGTPVQFNGSDFDAMISALPRRERQTAISNFTQNLTARILNGKQHYDTAMSGNPCPPPSQDDVADMMLFFKATAQSQGHHFVGGAYSVEDPQGRLAAYLDRCPERYMRSSTHLQEQQGLQVDGHRNTHRGIDFRAAHSMPHSHETVLYATIPPLPGGTRRLFLKTETYGARMSTLRSADEAAGLGTNQAPNRAKRMKDFGLMIMHFFSLIKSKFAGEGAQRKERIPTTVKTFYQAAINDFTRRGEQDLANILGSNHALKTGGGVRVMLANIGSAQTRLRASTHPNAAGLIQELEALKSNLIARLPDQSHAQERIGNEVMLQSTDL